MVHYFIYAKDYSGSTAGVDYYHLNGIDTLKQFKNDVKKITSELPLTEETRIIYLHWGHKCVQVDENTTLKTYKKRCGDGYDTLPEKIIEWIRGNIGTNKKIKLLYIITDGLIESDSLNRCLKLNRNIDYENVVFHGINPNEESIDLSVASSFLKSSCVIYRNTELLDKIDISEEFDYSKITVENFSTEKENLTSYIKYKFINSSKNNAAALREIEKLKALRNRLFNNASNRRCANLETTDKEQFIREFKNTKWYGTLTNSTYYCINKDIEKTISSLINYITTDKRSYAFDALKFETKYSNDVPEEEIVDVNFSPDQEIEFPDIILDDEKGIPVILLTEFNLLDKLIFQNGDSSASFSKFSSTMECPLFLLNDPDFNDSIGYFYTLNVYKQLLEKTQRTEPRTRKPFHGGIVLVDTDDFDRYNDYVLSASYFNSKKVKYNVGLFYFAIWKICEKKEWMDKNVVERLKKYIFKRISATVCKIGLSSLPLDPQINTTLPTALWYCVEISSYIFKDDPNHFTHERLRMFFGMATYMVEILKYLNYNLDMQFINRRKNLISTVSTLKKISAQKEKNFYLVEKIFKSIDGFIICEIENMSNIKKLNFLKLQHKEMLSDDIITEKINLYDFVHFIHNVDDSLVQICETTYRPFFMIDENISFYSELYKKAKRTVVRENRKGQISLHNVAIDKLDFTCILSYYNLYFYCVKEFKKYPSLEEYKKFVLRKKKFKDNLVTIFPINVHEAVERAFQRYEIITKNVSVSDFLEVYMKHVDRIDRIKAEKKRQFNSDVEIIEFIFKEKREEKIDRSKILYADVIRSSC